jgi:hypothetical protein
MRPRTGFGAAGGGGRPGMAGLRSIPGCILGTPTRIWTTS